jgi:AraC-like DNA-binding protein
VGVDGASVGCGEIRRIGQRVWTRAHPQGLGRHRHDEHWELHLLRRGRIAWVLDERPWQLHDGTVFLAAPGQSHSGIDSVAHRSAVCWFSIAARPARVLGLSAEATAELRRGLAAVARPCFAAGPALLAAFDVLLAEAARGAAADPLVVRSAATSVLAATVRDGAQAAAIHETPRVDDTVVAQAIAQLREHLRAPPTVAALAAACGLGRTALYQAFVAATGLSPSEYHDRLRLDRARVLLEAGGTLESVAADSGFASAQHLSRHFKAAYGCTPGAWRQRAGQAGVGIDGMPA